MRTSHRTVPLAAFVACTTLALFASACSSGSSGKSGSATTTTAAPRPSTVPRPARGSGRGHVEGDHRRQAVRSWVRRSRRACGKTATSSTNTSRRAPRRRTRPRARSTRDGRWTFAPDAKARVPHAVLVRRPPKPPKFSGTVVVEWLNVSGGVDADPDWASLEQRRSCARATRGSACRRSASAWRADRCSCRSGVPGAEAAGKGLKAIDPARYGSLAASRRRLLVRHLHAGRARRCAPGARPGRRASRSGSSPRASRSRRSRS